MLISTAGRRLLTANLPSFGPLIRNRFLSSQALAAATTSVDSSQLTPERIRNIAIIAHVDHGKTSLVDCLLKQSDTDMGSQMNQDRIMDSNDIERERGITILSKAASCYHGDVKINIVDTPGHADFGGQVERVLSMVDSVALLVDATEGPMTQTKFVLQKALKQHLRPIVIINKCDRPSARVDEVESEILDLFLSLDASDAQLEYPVVYASAKAGWASRNGPLAAGEQGSMKPLLDLILEHTAPPDVDLSSPFSLLVTQLETDSFVGRCLLGRLASGTIKIGDKIKALDENGALLEEGRVLKLFSRSGTTRTSIEHAIAGDIISVAGLSKCSVNATLCHEDVTEPIFSIPIDPPTISITVTVNDSPMQGQEGTKLTSSMIRERLFKEVETNVAMQVTEATGKDSFEVSGRGELHLGVLLENMRREGFEMCVSAPKVIFKYEKNGPRTKVLEPIEHCRIQVPQQFNGSVIQKMTKRKGELKNFVELGDEVVLEFEIPSRGLLGYPADFRHDTSGSGTINSSFMGYGPHKGDIDRSRKGSLISTAAGQVTPHAAIALEPRGTLYVKPGDQVYPLMVIGEHNKQPDCHVNPVKIKHLTNVRTALKDDTVRVNPPKTMTLEQMLAFIQEDEILEVTPKGLRIRKKQQENNKR